MWRFAAKEPFIRRFGFFFRLVVFLFAAVVLRLRAAGFFFRLVVFRRVFLRAVANSALVAMVIVMRSVYRVGLKFQPHSRF